MNIRSISRLCSRFMKFDSGWKRLNVEFSYRCQWRDDQCREFEILNEIRGEESLADATFVVDDEVDLFGHGSRACSEVSRIGNSRAADA